MRFVDFDDLVLLLAGHLLSRRCGVQRCTGEEVSDRDRFTDLRYAMGSARAILSALDSHRNSHVAIRLPAHEALQERYSRTYSSTTRSKRRLRLF